jgi:hypothetical protein
MYHFPDVQDTSSKETAHIAGTLPISAPVPVRYASLGKDALRSILEMRDAGKDILYAHYKPHRIHSELFLSLSLCFYAESSSVEDNQAHTVDENPEPDAAAAAPTNQLGGRLIAGSHNAHVQGGGMAAEPKMVIRPITPSTLMALTEPCLMAWCYAEDGADSDPKSHSGFAGVGASSETARTREEDCYVGLEYMYETGRMRNVWGY